MGIPIKVTDSKFQLLPDKSQWAVALPHAFIRKIDFKFGPSKNLGRKEANLEGYLQMSWLWDYGKLKWRKNWKGKNPIASTPSWYKVSRLFKAFLWITRFFPIHNQKCFTKFSWFQSRSEIIKIVKNNIIVYIKAWK